MDNRNESVVAAAKETLDAFASTLPRTYALLLIDPDAELAPAKFLPCLKGSMNSLRDVTGWPVVLVLPADELARRMEAMADKNGPMGSRILSAPGMPVVVIGPEGVTLHVHHVQLMSKGGQA